MFGWLLRDLNRLQTGIIKKGNAHITVRTYITGNVDLASFGFDNSAPEP